MAFELPALPYERNALAPTMSEETFNFHYGKHHKAYVDKLNDFVDGTPFASMDLEQVIQESWKAEKTPVFNNAAQVWNHTFFWNSMKPGGGGAPTGDLADRLAKDFGSYENFKKDWVAQGVGQFGSGWVWLVDDGGKLAIMKTPNAENPMVHGKKALLTADVWEHAYYLDYQNRRPDFLTAFLDHLVNWDFAAKNMQ